MKSLYVIGGQQRSLRSLLSGSQDWYEYQKGLILRISPEIGEVKTCIEYISPLEACDPDNPVILFKSGTLKDDKLYTCTQTEVLIYDIPSFKQLSYITLPCFNDLHHVRPYLDDHLLVVNTGLDMVLEITMEGEILREWDVLGGNPWDRFSKTIDYRKGVSTKPHKAHPNHIFCIDEDIWVTRFQQKDAVCLTHPNRRIELNVERPHDGVVQDGFVYFTTVNGNIIVANPKTLKIESVIDLNKMHPDDVLLGWCRGIMLDGECVWVGFSRLRPTRFRENVSWVVQGFKHVMPTHLACYDLTKGCCVLEMELETYRLNTIFSIFPGNYRKNVKSEHHNVADTANQFV